jgi:hypothetical protein
VAGTWMGMALLMAAVSRDAAATTFAELTLEQFTDAATYIVEGQVEEVWTELDPQTSMVWTRARVNITETYKGPDQPSELIIDSMGGRVGDYEVYIPGAASFSEGEDIFVFLAENGPHWVPISKFQGKYTLRRAPGERRQHAMQWQTRRGETFDARFLPHPDPEYRLYLDELRQRVADQLAVGWDGEPIMGISFDRLQQVNRRSTP